MTTANLSDEQRAALDDFDAARDTFLTAFAQAPDEALNYLPTGDEYAVGTLLPHLCDPIDRYLGVFDLMRAADFELVDLSADPARAEREAQRHVALVAMHPTGADRAGMLADLAAAHARVHAAMATVSGEDYARSAPVIYSAGTEPFGTSFREIMQWITDHYDEHTAQVGEMLEAWQGAQ